MNVFTTTKPKKLEMSSTEVWTMKIVRTPTRASGGITSEEKMRMGALVEKWKSIAFKTGRCDVTKITDAIERLYASAGLKKPRVVVVPSPFVMACAYGVASCWWALRGKLKSVEATASDTEAATRAATFDATDAATDATDAATDAATFDATREATVAATRAATRAATFDATAAATDAATRVATDAATRAATFDATDAATNAATFDATREATVAATRAATRAATNAATFDATADATDAATDAATRVATDAATRVATDAATFDATDAATFVATRDATFDATDAATDATDAATDATDAATKQKKDWLVYLAKKFVGARFRAALEGVKKWADVYQGGNMWAMLPCYVEAMRDVIGLTGLPVWEQYKAWEDAATYGGFRVMHEKFCIVSDFPEVLKTDSRGRAHCATGPSHRWRDGFEIYHLNGIRVPKWLVMTDAGKIDPMLALNEKNVDVQREIIRKIGAERMLKAVGAKTVDTFVDCHTKGGNVYELKELLVGQISRKYLYYEHASVPGYWYAQAVPPNTKRAIHARAWILGMDSPEQKTDEEIRAFLPEVVS
ncbi:MAG: hypothetical protein IPK56_11780 [Elusimicrobia bacterium]|nr:hypothetical protein [Elusimicrobiota bacterium]